MRYYKYDDEWSEIDGGITYIETDDGWTIRQITINGDRYLASNLVYPHWGMVLGEGQVDYDDIAEVTEATQAEFEATWQTYLAHHIAAWQASKAQYPLGVTVIGQIQIFYPQGVIVNLGDETLAVADHTACYRSAEPNLMSTGDGIQGIVSGYDEANHWLMLDYPKITTRRTIEMH